MAATFHAKHSSYIPLVLKGPISESQSETRNSPTLKAGPSERVVFNSFFLKKGSFFSDPIVDSPVKFNKTLLKHVSTQLTESRVSIAEPTNSSKCKIQINNHI
jgi:hypothetical protein